MIEDFLVKNPINIGLPVRNIDFKKIMQLSDHDFAQLYLELMTEYRYNDGWWHDYFNIQIIKNISTLK